MTLPPPCSVLCLFMFFFYCFVLLSYKIRFFTFDLVHLGIRLPDLLMRHGHPVLLSAVTNWNFNGLQNRNLITEGRFVTPLTGNSASVYSTEQAVISSPELCLLWHRIHFYTALVLVQPSGCSPWTEPSGPERQGNLARVMEMMRKVLEYCQSPIYRVERARERERSSDREGLSEDKRHGSTREWSPTHKRAGIGFVFMWRAAH